MSTGTNLRQEIELASRDIARPEGLSMKKLLDQLLQETLKPYATYSERQMLKAGQIGACASQILQRRQKAAQRSSWLFLGLLSLPVVVFALFTMSFNSIAPMSTHFYVMFIFAALTQIPSLIDARFSQARLETLIAIWMLSDQNTSLEPEEKSASLARLIFENK
ncbi:MAG: hypothetical protein C0478_03780 [Planctomyces sp.]|nr:hypothetical protein [Planctomyces sp.]